MLVLSAFTTEFFKEGLVSRGTGYITEADYFQRTADG
jgi:hypothetical protein